MKYVLILSAYSALYIIFLFKFLVKFLQKIYFFKDLELSFSL